MTTVDIWLLAMALAMDCLAVSIASGVIVRRILVRMAVLFGTFQALMPLMGWMATSRFSSYLEAFDHWIAFGLLAIIGGNMIRESFSNGERSHFDPTRLTTQLLLAVATSIDAFAAGISLACVGYRTLAEAAVPLFVIGFTSLLFSIIGQSLGIKFGRSIERKLRPELVGGIILLLIGFKILFVHLTE